MSGFAYNLKTTTAMTPVAYCTDDEAAGKVGKIIGVIAAVVVPFAAPMVWGAITASGAIGAGLGTFMTSTFGSLAGNIIGSALTGAVMNAGAAYLGGARGGDVWRAAGMGALGGGIGQAMGAGSFFGGGAAAPKPGLPGAAGSLGKVSTNVLGQQVNAMGQIVQTTGQAIGGTVPQAAAGGLMQQIGQIFTGGSPINRIGTALLNAIVNNGSQRELDALVEQQRAALAGLSAQEQAAYAQRMSAAQEVLAAANRMDPAWLARVRMADVAGVMNREHDTALRNIATKQGGSLDAGQRKAYERSGRLAIGRAKARAYGEGHAAGTQAQAQLFGQAAGLFTGPSLDAWRLENDMLAARYRTRSDRNQSTAAGFLDVFGGGNYPQPTSPEQNNDDEDENTSGLGTQRPFFRG